MANDLALYDEHGDGWWDPADRAFASLRSINPMRLELVMRWGTSSFPLGLAGRDVVDLGCGGGLLSVPLAEAGARVVGVDRSATSLACARRRAPACCSFLEADLRDTGLPAGSADLVLLADVLEHLEDPASALREAARLLRPRGAVFVTTINATLRARLLAVVVAEGLRLIPRGTHDPRLFLSPATLAAHAADAGLALQYLTGEAVCPLQTLRRRAVVLREGRSVAVGYSGWLRRPALPVARMRAAVEPEVCPS